MNTLINTFNGGEISPHVDARVDIEKYRSGCRTLENFVPRIYGDVQKRDGLRFVANQYGTAGDNIRMVTFSYSSTEVFPIEFGDLYARLIEELNYDDEPLLYEGNQLIYDWPAVTTPYQKEDLMNLQFKQVGNVMRIVHESYHPSTITRTSVRTIQYEEIAFEDGPFLLRNDLINPSILSTAYMTMALPSFSSAGVSESSTDIGQNLIYGTGGTARWASGGIIPESTFTITQIKFKAFRSGNGITSIVVGLRAADEFGVPTGSDLSGSTVTIDVSGWTLATSAWRTVTFSSSQTLYKNHYYALVIRPDATGYGDSSNYIGWDVTGDINDPTKGNAEQSTDGGATWSYPQSYLIQAMISIPSPSYTFDGSGITTTLSCVDVNNADVSFFDADHVGALFKLTYPRDIKVSKGTYTNESLPFVLCEEIPVKGDFRFSTSGKWDGTIELQRRENSTDSTAWETDEAWTFIKDGNASVAKTETESNVEYRCVVTAFNSYSDYKLKANITISNPTQDAIVKVTSFTDSANVEVEVLSGPILATSVRRWAEGAWSDFRGFPSSITFFEERCVYGGMCVIQQQVTVPYSPSTVTPKIATVWLSHSGDYDTFEEGTNDSDSFNFAVATGEQLLWIDSIETLFIGTTIDEWQVKTNKLDQPLTPTNFTVKRHSSYGSIQLQPLNLQDVIIFVDTGGFLREITYEDSNSKEDLNILSEHITKEGVTDFGYQYGIESIIWCVLGDNSLASLTYERSQNVIAWSRHPMDGKVQSVCVVTKEIESEVWFSIERTVNSTQIVHIEKMVLADIDTIEDSFYLDSGNTYCESFTLDYDGEDLFFDGHKLLYGDETTTINNANHLIGTNITALIDGIKYDNIRTDSSGTITLPTAGLLVQYGIVYDSLLQPMRIAFTAQDGTSFMLDTKVSRVLISLLNSGFIEQSSDNETYYEIDLTNVYYDNLSEIGNIFTGDVEATSDSDFDPLNPIYIRSSSPLPLTVRCIVPKVDITNI